MFASDDVVWERRTSRATTSGDEWTHLALSADGIIVHRMLNLRSIVVSKLTAGFSDDCVPTLSALLDEIERGLPGELKFLVIDFAHLDTEPSGSRALDFEHLVARIANLILKAPVVTVAWARGPLAGADLELALACSMFVGEQGATFSFGADPVTAVRTYEFLARKIGFVRAERLMEGEDVLGVEEMCELLLLKDVLPRGAGLAGIEAFVHRGTRRHNSSYGIYRAQRIAMPVLPGPAN